MTLAELSTRLLEEHGVSAAGRSIARILKSAGYTYKKTLVATERGRADVRHKRNLWHKKQKLMKLEPHRLVFIDETSTKTNMARMYGRSLKGTRLEADAPYGHWGT